MQRAEIAAALATAAAVVGAWLTPGGPDRYVHAAVNAVVVAF